MKFKLGEVVMTRPALSFCEMHKVNTFALLARHSNADWGDLSESDKVLNDMALEGGDDRIFSSYNVGPGKLWIITEWDRSVTTILLPEDY
jgi:hypothetical protein